MNTATVEAAVYIIYEGGYLQHLTWRSCLRNGTTKSKTRLTSIRLVSRLTGRLKASRFRGGRSGRFE